jgi:hypothetical protein
MPAAQQLPPQRQQLLLLRLPQCLLHSGREHLPPMPLMLLWAAPARGFTSRLWVVLLCLSSLLVAQHSCATARHLLLLLMAPLRPQQRLQQPAWPEPLQRPPLQPPRLSRALLLLLLVLVAMALPCRRRRLRSLSVRTSRGQSSEGGSSRRQGPQAPPEASEPTGHS